MMGAPMKKLECIIRPDKLTTVEQALRAEHIGGMTITEVKGFGRQRRIASTKIKLEIYAMDMELDTILKVIRHAAYTGKVGDGKIAILPMDNVVRIRTEEQGATALL
jgi:nitrogen regulatory protein P-II 1